MDDRFQACLVAVGLAIAAACPGQQIQVGNLPDSPNFVLPVPVGGTAVDLFVGAPAAAILTTATFEYSSFPCPAAVSIQFGRPPRRTGEPIGFLASRGPFDATQARQTVTLSPPVSVLAGDLIAITRLTDCGDLLGEAPFPGFLLIFPQGTYIGGTVGLAAFGTATPNNGVASVIPVVYTGGGAAGSHFRTVARLYNPTGDSISGDLEFPGISYSYQHQYSLGPYQVASLDFLPPFASIDILPRVGRAPVGMVHLFNDLGPSGTVGFTESDVPFSEALGPGEHGVLLGPADPTNFRFNIGYRSMGATASVVVTARKSDGTTAASASLSPFYSLAQASFEQLLGVALEPNTTLTIEVTSGNALFYGVTADNRTNDTGFQLARRVDP